LADRSFIMNEPLNVFIFFFGTNAARLVSFHPIFFFFFRSYSGDSMLPFPAPSPPSNSEIAPHSLSLSLFHVLSGSSTSRFFHSLNKLLRPYPFFCRSGKRTLDGPFSPLILEVKGSRFVNSSTQATLFSSLPPSPLVKFSH